MANGILEVVIDKVSKHLTFALVSGGLTILTTCTAVVYKKIDSKFSLFERKINAITYLTSIKQDVQLYNVTRYIENILLDCKLNGIFISWIRVEPRYDVENVQCLKNQSCPVLKDAIYFKVLRGVWGDVNVVNDIMGGDVVNDMKGTNPFYQREDLMLDVETKNYFLNANLYQYGIITVTEKIVKDYAIKENKNLVFLEDVYKNLGLLRQGLTLEKIYIKPVMYIDDIIWVFALSYQKEPLKNSKCYDVNLQAQSIILNNIADYTKKQHDLI
jgi:hypothetical protein